MNAMPTETAAIQDGRSEASASPSRFYEFRLILPIALAWLGLFAGAIYFACYWLYGVGYWPDFLLFAVAALGVLGIAIWLGLYGKRFVRRFLLAPVLTGVVACPATWAYCFLRGEEFGSYWMIPLAAIGVCFPMMLLVIGFRLLFGWRIVEASEAEDRSRPRLTIAVILSITFAVASTIGIAKGTGFEFRGGFGIWIAILGVPLLWATATVAVLGRLSLRWVWLPVLLLAATAGVATFGCLVLQLEIPDGGELLGRPDRGRPSLLYLYLAPQVGSYIVACTCILLSALYLRSKRVLILCGGKHGFASPLKPSEKPLFPLKSIRYASACAALLVAVFIARMAYNDWSANNPIPSFPAIRDLPRLYEAVIAQPDQQQRAVRGFPPAVYQRRSTRGMRHRERSSQASEAIIRIGSDAIPFLLDKANSAKTDEAERAHASWSLLGRIAREQGFGEHKGDVLASVGNLENVAPAMGVFVAMPDEATKIILEQLQSSDPQRVFAAAKIIGCYGGTYDDETIQVIAEAALAGSQGRHSLSVLIDALVRVGGDRATPTLLTVLQDSTTYSEFDRASAAEAISAMALVPADAIHLIYALFQDSKESDVRKAALRSLGNIGPAAQEAAPTLLEILASRQLPGPAVNGENQSGGYGDAYGGATGAYGSYSEGGYGAYGTGPNLDAPEYLWMEAMAALGKMQAANAAPQIAAVVFDEPWDQGIKLRALRALGAMGSEAKPYSAQIKELAETEATSAESLQLRTNAMVALTRVHVDRAEKIVPVLIRQLAQGRTALAKSSRVGDETMESDLAIQKARIACLIWLGSRGDRGIIKQPEGADAEPMGMGWLNRSRLPRLVQWAAGAEVTFALTDVIESGIRYGGQMVTIDPEEWTLGGRVRCLAQAMEIGLASDDPTVRGQAADALAEMGRRYTFPFVEELLKKHLGDDNATVRAHVAAGLVMAGADLEEHLATIAAGAKESGDATPVHIRLLLADPTLLDLELQRIRQTAPY